MQGHPVLVAGDVFLDSDSFDGFVEWEKLNEWKRLQLQIERRER